MDPESIIAAVQRELGRHTFDTFKLGSPQEAVAGCPVCQKPMQTLAQYVGHLCDEVIPATIRQAFLDERPRNAAGFRAGGRNG